MFKMLICQSIWVKELILQGTNNTEKCAVQIMQSLLKGARAQKTGLKNTYLKI